MTDERRLVSAERIQILCREKTSIGENGVQSFDTVPLALHMTVAIGVSTSSGGHVQDIVVQNVEDINSG